MRPEEYRSLIKRLETHYQEFLQTSKGSEMFGEDDKNTIQGHFEKAQDHYETLVIQLPAYSEFKTPSTDTNVVKTMRFFSTRFLISSKFSPTDKEEEGGKTETIKPSVAKPVESSQRSTLSLTLLTSLQELHRRLELAESGLTSHLHVPLGENSLHECSVHIQKLQVFTLSSLCCRTKKSENTHKSVGLQYRVLQRQLRRGIAPFHGTTHLHNITVM